MAKVTQSKREQRAEALQGVFQVAGLVLAGTGNLADTAAIGIHQENISDEVAKAAETDEGIARVLNYLTTASPYSGIIIAVMPLVLQILANHGRIAAGVMGTVKPETLEVQAKAEAAMLMTRMQKDAITAQRAAELEIASLAELQRAYNAQNGQAEE